MNRSPTATKPETVFENRDAVRHYDRAIPTPALRINTAPVGELPARVLDRLDADQRRAMDGISYNMEAMDDLLDETYRLAKQFVGALEYAERISLAQRFLDEYEGAIVNLARTIEMCNLYLKGEYSTAITRQHDRRNYEEMQSS
jgi:hypothetical protein